MRYPGGIGGIGGIKGIEGIGGISGKDPTLNHSATNCVTLLPGSSQHFHLNTRLKSQWLQVRRRRENGGDGANGVSGNGGHSQGHSRGGSRSSSVDGENIRYEEWGGGESLGDQWEGEIDIVKLGVMYAKLRLPSSHAHASQDPSPTDQPSKGIMLVKILVEVVGASLVATFIEQSLQWPPYRIDNLTDFKLRFRQHVSAPKILGTVLGTETEGIEASLGRTDAGSDGKGGRKYSSDCLHDASEPYHEQHSDAHASGDTFNTLYPSHSTRESTLCHRVLWDTLDGGDSAPYSWDLPFSGGKSLSIGLLSGTNKVMGADAQRQQANRDTGGVGGMGGMVGVGGMSGEKAWVATEFNLSNETTVLRFSMQKALPSLGNPLAEGTLYKYNSNAKKWVEVYCILKPDLLYVYEDVSRSTLVDLVKMSAYRESDGSPQFAAVRRYGGDGSLEQDDRCGRTCTGLLCIPYTYVFPWIIMHKHMYYVTEAFPCKGGIPILPYIH